MALSAALAGRAEAAGCRWAPSANLSGLVDPTSGELERVFALIGASEAAWVRGPGIVAGMGLTRDGAVLNYSTGGLVQTHAFSAASKEGFHLAIAARCLDDAARLAGRPQPGTADAGLRAAQVAMLRGLCGWDGPGPAYWLGVLEDKLASYAAFSDAFPGFAGFLPWFAVPSGPSGKPGDAGLLSGWEDRVPALDNGEMFWGLVAAGSGAGVLGSTSSPHAARAASLAASLRRAWGRMAASARAVFWAPPASVWDVVRVTNVSLPPSAPGQFTPDGGGTLDDPYEGELFTWALDLFGGLNATQRLALWRAKRPLLRAVTYRRPAGAPASAGEGDVTVQRGFWFSAHEQMKLLYLPYADASLVPTSAAVFRACEVARAADSAARGVPGLFASVTDVATVPASPRDPARVPGYISAAGVQALASQTIARRDVITPYGAMAMAAVAPREAAVWYVNTLRATAMQGPLGSTCACNTNGTEITPVVTWDAKASTVTGLLGGVGDLTARELRARADPSGQGSMLDRFRTVVERETQAVFGRRPAGADDAIALPAATVPRTSGLSDFSECSA